MVRCKSVVKVGVTVGSLGWASVCCFILLPAPSPGTLWPATMKSCHSAETGWWRLRSPGAATTWWTPPSGSQVCVLHLRHVRRMWESEQLCSDSTGTRGALIFNCYIKPDHSLNRSLKRLSFPPPRGVIVGAAATDPSNAEGIFYYFVFIECILVLFSSWATALSRTYLWESQCHLETLIPLSETAGCVNKYARCVTHWSCRNDVGFEPSQVAVEETRISGGTDSDTTPELHPVDIRSFSLVLPRRLSLSFFTFFVSSISSFFFFHSREFPQLVTGGNNASSCFWLQTGRRASCVS